MSASEIVVYQSDDGSLRVECRFEDQRVWLTQAQMATLSQTTPQNITQHLRAIDAEGELEQSATCKEGLQVRTEGRRQVSRAVLHYDLAAIVAVGLRVRSSRGTQFRQWAIARLGEYLLKGFVMDDARLRAPDRGGVPDDFGKHRPDLRFGQRPAAQRRWLHRALPEPRDTNLPSVAALETSLSRGLPLHGGAL